MHAQGGTSRAFLEARRSRRKDTDTATCITTHAKETPPRHEQQQEARAHVNKQRRKKAHNANHRTKKTGQTHPSLKHKKSEHKRDTKKEGREESRQKDTQDKRSRGKPSLQTQLPANQQREKKKSRKRGLKLRSPQPIT